MKGLRERISKPPAHTTTHTPALGHAKRSRFAFTMWWRQGPKLDALLLPAVWQLLFQHCSFDCSPSPESDPEKLQGSIKHQHTSCRAYNPPQALCFVSQHCPLQAPGLGLKPLPLFSFASTNFCVLANVLVHVCDLYTDCVTLAPGEQCLLSP